MILQAVSRSIPYHLEQGPSGFDRLVFQPDTGTFAPFGLLLLCSDGVHGTCAFSTLETTLAASRFEDLDSVADALLRLSDSTEDDRALILVRARGRHGA